MTLWEKVYQNDTADIPLYDHFKAFHVHAHGDLLQTLKQHANSFKDNAGNDVPDIHNQYKW